MVEIIRSNGRDFLVKCSVCWLFFMALLIGEATLSRYGVTGALPIEESRWERKIFLEPDSGLSYAEAASLKFCEDEGIGGCLAVGPWSAGRWSARFQYRGALPVTTGTIRGYYRTQDLLPYQAGVFVDFHRNADRLKRIIYPLSVAEDWTPFTIRLRGIATGTDHIRVGFGLAEKTGGRVLFADISVAQAREPSVFPAAPERITRETPRAAQIESRFFRVERQGDTWWLVTPDGRAGYSLGTEGPSLQMMPAGLQEAREYALWLKRTGFNSLGGWSNPWRWGRVNDSLAAEGKIPFPLFNALSSNALGDSFDWLVNARGETTGKGHEFPDPFDPGFERAYRETVRDISERVKGRSWFIGWFADNERSHKELHRHVYSEHCSRAFRDWLRERYREIDTLNTAWNSEFSSFQDVVEKRPDPVRRRGVMYEDFQLFKREIVKRYIEITLKVIREQDPDHLIFSNRFMAGGLGDWLDMADLYASYDGIAINIYPDNQEAGLGAAEQTLLEMVHAESGKPVIVSEWSIPALDSGLYDDSQKLDWSMDTVVETQVQRARQAMHVGIDLYNLPFVIGAHWYTWKDFNTDSRRANRGLFRANGEPWRELIDSFSGTNRMIREHSANQ